MPYITNKHLTFPETIEEIKILNTRMKYEFRRNPLIYIENVAYQASVSQHLVVEGLLAQEVNVSGLDKRSRLSITTPYIQNGRVLFPRKGAEELISQITNLASKNMMI